MDEIKIVDKRIDVPEEYTLSPKKRRLKIRTPWSSELQVLAKNNFNVTTQCHFRHPSHGDKPFIPEGLIEIDGILFKAVEEKNSDSSQTKLVVE